MFRGTLFKKIAGLMVMCAIPKSVFPLPMPKNHVEPYCHWEYRVGNKTEQQEKDALAQVFLTRFEHVEKVEYIIKWAPPHWPYDGSDPLKTKITAVLNLGTAAIKVYGTLKKDEFMTKASDMLTPGYTGSRVAQYNWDMGMMKQGLVIINNG